MTVDEMINNLERICQAEGCRLDIGPDWRGMMYVEFGYLEGPVPEDEPRGIYPNAQARYLTCMHEIGHFYWSHTQGRPWTPEYQEKAVADFSPDYWEDYKFYFNNGVLRSEAEAWNYALDYCGIPSDEILPETREFIWEKCLNSYFSHARAVGFETPGQKLYNGDRHYVEFAYGKPDAYFFQTKRRIIEGDLEDMALPKNPIRNNINWTNMQELINPEWITPYTITSNTTGI